MLVKITNNGESFLCSPRQAGVLELLLDSNAGGFASVKGYVSSETGEVADYTFISRFSVGNMYERAMAALETFTVADIIDSIRDNLKVKALTTDELYEAFDARRAAEIASKVQTLEGDRSDARRQSHDRNYHVLDHGVKVHYVTEKVDKLTYPVLESYGNERLPVVKSIMLNILEVKKTVTTAGTYKTVNSGVPVIIGNALNKLLPKTAKMKVLSFKDDNFDSLALAGVQYIPEDFKGLYSAS
jgi:hypothetical protein